MKILIKGLLGFAVLLAAVQATAEEFLNADEVKALVVGNTIHALHLKKDFEFAVYFDADGRTAVRKQNDNIAQTTYKFDGNKHCLYWKDADRCAHIKNNGDGTYTRVKMNGTPIVKWIKIVKGKEL